MTLEELDELANTITEVQAWLMAAGFKEAKRRAGLLRTLIRDNPE